MTARRPSERVVVPIHIRKLMHWVLPLDERFQTDFLSAPKFPNGETDGDEDRACKVLRILPKDEELLSLQRKLNKQNRHTEASQVNRLRDMRWHAVNLLEKLERFDVLDEYDVD